MAVHSAGYLLVDQQELEHLKRLNCFSSFFQLISNFDCMKYKVSTSHAAAAIDLAGLQSVGYNCVDDRVSA